MIALRLPPAIHARPTAPGHTRVNLAPSLPPLILHRAHHPATTALPFLPRKPLSPTTRSLTSLTLRGRTVAAFSLTCSPRPLANPKPRVAPCHPAARGRAGGGGARRPGGVGAGLFPRLIIPASENLSGPRALTVHWSRKLARGGITWSPAPAYLRSLSFSYSSKPGGWRLAPARALPPVFPQFGTCMGVGGGGWRTDVNARALPGSVRRSVRLLASFPGILRGRGTVHWELVCILLWVPVIKVGLVPIGRRNVRTDKCPTIPRKKNFALNVFIPRWVLSPKGLLYHY